MRRTKSEVLKWNFEPKDKDFYILDEVEGSRQATLSITEDKVRVYLKAQSAINALSDIENTYKNNQREHKKIVDIITNYDESLMDLL
tara:strand:+ start:2068 stop:2328 length:261 start_codon:yes stop_codon:yes gene_type:complete